MKKLVSIILVATILLAACLRLWHLGSIPDGFHSDEASYGYNAYSILTIGKDEHGASFPLSLQAFGDYKPALYAYIDIPFIYFLGLDPTAVRLPSAVFGIMTVPLLFFFIKKLFNNDTLSLLSAFLLAISPWHIALSRTTSEVVLSVFFLLLMSYALLFLKKFSAIWFSVAVLAAVFAIMSYTASRFFVVIIVGIFITFSLSKIKAKISVNKLYIGFFILVLLLGLLYSSVDKAGRFAQINIATSPETQLVLDEQLREETGTPLPIIRVFHNKVINYSRTFLANYSEYFTLRFLALEGGNPLRQTIPGSGLFYLWQIPFLLLGVYVIISAKNKQGILLLCMILLLLIPAAVTFDEIPNVYRTLVILPFILPVIGMGLLAIISFSQKYPTKFVLPLLGLFVGIALFESLYFSHQYIVHAEMHRPWSRNYAYKELVPYLATMKHNYKEVLVTKANSDPYIFLLFYNTYNPAAYLEQGSSGNTDGRGFDSYRFTNLDCPLSGGPKGLHSVKGEVGVLYINRGDCPDPKNNVKLVTVINWKDGNPAFRLMEYVPDASLSARLHL